MNRFRIIFSFLTIMLFMGCEDTFEPKQDETFTGADTWRLPDKALGVLYNAYAAMGSKIDAYGDNFLDCATDNAITNDYGSAIYRLSQGGMSASNNPLDIWNKAYAQFTNINLFFENGLSDKIRYSLASDEVDLKYKKKYKGEAFFLRAWWGWQLLQVYGGKSADGQALGYPIVLSSTDGNQNKPRATYEQCVYQIIKDLDSALVYLPITYTGDDAIIGSTGKGKASGAASVALKSIVYLYAASDAFQPDGVTPSERESKWIRAAHAADQAIRSSGIGAPKYLTEKAFGGSSNDIDVEFLLAMQLGNTSSFEKKNYTPYYYGRAITNPSENLAQAFPMENGYPITHPNSKYDITKPYMKRDSRFYLNIYHNGAAFKAKTIDVYRGGKDSYNVDSRASRTGYYLRKWIVDIVHLEPGAQVAAYHFYPQIRKTEVWLAFAEAANQAWGPNDTDPEYTQGRTAYDVIKAIRAGAGITNTDYLNEVAAQGKNEFDDLILNERRLELAFENQRYFDLRRRLKLQQMREPVNGVDVELIDGDFKYTTKKVEDRKFDDEKYIYSPIPFAEISKNSLLIQNKGW